MRQDEEEPRKEPHNDIDDDNDIFGLRSLKNLVMNLSPNLVIRQIHPLIVFTQKKSHAKFGFKKKYKSFTKSLVRSPNCHEASGLENMTINRRLDLCKMCCFGKTMMFFAISSGKVLLLFDEQAISGHI